ncbi:hypothetical protein DFS34DRAFT_591550 [Phlyctochytrium arcticum]|nr:hypothetical protein DFS34DRAFT_591550 [Phlyctochytrium arcticum]
MAVQESGVYCGPDWGGILRPQPYPKVNQALTILNGIIVFTSTFHLTGIHIAIWLSVRNAARRFAIKDTSGSLTLHKLNNTPKSVSKSKSKVFLESLRKLPSKVLPESVNKSTSREVLETPPVAIIHTVESASPDHLPAVIFSKLEQGWCEPNLHFCTKDANISLFPDVARKCAIMVTSFLIIWAPHTYKALLVGFTQRPTTAQFEMIGSLLAICPGTFLVSR